MIKIRYTCFWPGFNPQSFFINNFLDDYKIVNDDSYDVIVMSVFNYANLKVKDNSIKILFNGEHPSYIDRFINITNIKLDLVIGFTQNNLNITQLYYPLWILYYDKVYNQTYFDNINKHIKNIKIEDLVNKKFCCLINSHDSNNTRIPIYSSLIKFNRIDCPGRLLNNMKNIGTSEKDKIKFMNNYLFNICSENGRGNGYLTEKLPQCLESLCIPIYYGDINRFNSNIFNINRIINIQDINNLDNIIDKINNLLKNKEELLNFYRQDIFNSNAYKYIEQINNIAKITINKIINKNN